MSVVHRAAAAKHGETVRIVIAPIRTKQKPADGRLRPDGPPHNASPLDRFCGLIRVSP
jgi:hypothetical protein